MYLLDTDVISAIRRQDRAPRVAAWIRGKPESELFLSVVTLGELERGIRGQERRDPDFSADLRRWVNGTVNLFSDRILAFGIEEARVWGRLSQELGHPGAALMIAATALSGALRW